MGMGAPVVEPTPMTSTWTPILAASRAAPTASSSKFSPSVMMMMAFCDFLLWEKPFIAMLIAAPMAVPWVGAILVLMPFRNNLAEAASPVMGICM